MSSQILGRLALGAFASTAALLIATGAANAQASGCGDLQKHLLERKSIADKLSASGKNKQIDAKVACTGFNQLVRNGEVLIKWTETNREWCSIPDSFIDGIKADNGKATQIRAKACGVASKQQQMEQQARKNGGPGQGGLLGGNGISGNTSLPQGAL